MVGILHFAEGFKGPVQIVIDDTETVSVVIEGFPALDTEVLGIVGHGEGFLQYFRAAQFGHPVHVNAYDEVGVVGQQGSERIVHLVVAELQLVEFMELEREVTVADIEHCRGVGGVIDWPLALNESFAGKLPRLFVEFADVDGERAFDTFVGSVLLVGPVALIEETRDGFLQIVIHAGFCAFHALGVQFHAGAELLGLNGWAYQKEDGNDNTSQSRSHISSTMSLATSAFGFKSKGLASVWLIMVILLVS